MKPTITRKPGRPRVNPPDTARRTLMASDEDWRLAAFLAAEASLSGEGHSISHLYSKALRFYFAHRSGITDNGIATTNGKATNETL